MEDSLALLLIQGKNSRGISHGRDVEMTKMLKEFREITMFSSEVISKFDSWLTVSDPRIVNSCILF